MLGDETVFVMQGPRSPLPKAVSRRDGGRLESLEGEIDAEKQLPHETVARADAPEPEPL